MELLSTKADYRRELEAEGRLAEIAARLAHGPVRDSPLYSLPWMPPIACSLSSEVLDEDLAALSRRDAPRAKGLVVEDAPTPLAQDRLARLQPSPRRRPVSMAALPRLRRIDPELAARFEQIGRLEGQADPLMLPILAVSQFVTAEALLKKALLPTDSSFGEALIQHVKERNPRARLEELFAGAQPVLGHVEVVAIGLRRALVAHSASVRAWVDKTFAAFVTRFRNEHLITVDVLGNKQLCRFVHDLRESRNLAVHDFTHFAFSDIDYGTWCDSAYACLSARQWLKKGTNPRPFKPTSVGWLSFLVAAIKPTSADDQ